MSAAGSPVTNLRDWVISPSMGTDVKNTEQLKPGAHKTSAEKSSNETKQYDTSGGVPHGPGKDGAMSGNV